MPGTETWLLRHRLRAAGFEPYLFHFRTVSEGLDGNAAQLARFVARVPGETVHLVGYSLGGVVAAHMLQTYPPARPGRLVCLGAPLRGTLSGRSLARRPWGARFVGKSIRDLLDRGGLPPWSVDRDLGIIAGDLAVGLGRLLGELPRPNDGTVGVEETRLEGGKDHLVLPLSHTALLFSRVVAEQVAHFLRRGSFDR
jgi:pimeloyl-ACP methyl ester carboxylesterase